MSNPDPEEQIQDIQDDTSLTPEERERASQEIMENHTGDDEDVVDWGD